MTKRGFLFILEGGDGSGKTAQKKKIVAWFRAKGFTNVIEAHEPGTSPAAQKIREILLDGAYNLDGETQALLFAAARNELYGKMLLPALEDGAIIISDRSAASSVAYQGKGLGVGVDRVLEINRRVMDMAEPDLVIYFDVSKETQEKRLGKRSLADINHYDVKGEAFKNLVREGYREYGQRFDHYVEIDANGSYDEVFENCMREITRVMEQKGIEKIIA